MHVLVTCKNKKDPIKAAGARAFTIFSHYKSIRIFPDSQGQLTLQSMVGSGLISNSFETLFLSSLPAKMKKIRSKIKALEWPQDDMLIFLVLKGRLLRSQSWDLAEIQTLSSFYARVLLPARMNTIQ